MRNARDVPPLLGWLAALMMAWKFLVAWSAEPTPSSGLEASGCRPGGDRSASREDRPELLYFRAPWCLACRALEAQGFSDGLVAEKIRSHYSCWVIDGFSDANRSGKFLQGLAERFRVRAYPTLVIASPEGQELRRLEGFPGLYELRRFVEPELREKAPR